MQADGNLVLTNEDGLPLVCGGAKEDSDVGCYTFFPKNGPGIGSWTEIGQYDSSFLP